MVAKISLGNSLYGALAYNGEKINKEDGRLLDTNKIYNDGSGSVDIKRTFADFMRWMPSTTKTEKPMVHISLNPHPDDVLTDAQYTQLAHEYMEKMGFGDMPYMVYKHMDIGRHHLHIVALRVDTDGKCISDRNNFYRSKNICRELEAKYNLRPTERQRVTPDTPITRLDPSGDIKKQLANTVKLVAMRYRFRTPGEFNAVLGLFNVKCEQVDGRARGREYHGMVYFALDDNGNVIAAPLKGARLGKFASRTAIDNRFERAAREIEDRNLTTATRARVEPILAASTGLDDFKTRLKEVGIDLVLRFTDEGRIYGVTFIDHNSMCVFNGSRLGREYSANAINERFNSAEGQQQTPPQPQKQTPPVDTPVPVNDEDSGQNTGGQDNAADIGTEQTRAPRQSQAAAQSDDYDFTIHGLDLFHNGQTINPDEEAFIRRMKRKKKKRGQGPKI